MELVDNIPGFSRTDRMGLTAFASVLIHLVVILGVTFSVPDASRIVDELPTLEITLVNTRGDSEPEEADFLAQANQDGGGDSDKPVVARSPLPIEPSLNTLDTLPAAQLASTATPATVAPRVEFLTQENQPARKITEREAETPPAPDSPTETRLGVVEKTPLENERARLSAELSEFWQEYQKRPRRKFLSARTKQYKYAAYMEAWRTRVEHVGNLNYPEQARREKLTGSLVLDVEIKPGGDLHAVTVIRPSGHKLLDDAAVRIVRLSAPFEPFPQNIRQDVDILHITRTWQFITGDRLVSR